MSVRAFLIIKTGDTYFRAFGTIIGSESLTTVFGMGTGVTFPIWSPEETRRAVKPDRACLIVVFDGTCAGASGHADNYVSKRLIRVRVLNTSGQAFVR